MGQTAHEVSPSAAGLCPGQGAAQHAKVWVTLQKAIPLRSPPEGSPVLEKVREAGSKGQALDLRMQVKPCSALEQQRPDDGADLLVQTPAKVHLLLVGGTCCFLISLWDHPPNSLSHCLFTFCLVPCPHLTRNKTVPLPPAPTAPLRPPDGRPWDTFVCLNLQKTFHGANKGQAANERTN